MTRIYLVITSKPLENEIESTIQTILLKLFQLNNLDFSLFSFQKSRTIAVVHS